MKIEQFEKEFEEDKANKEVIVSIITADDMKNPTTTKIIVDGEEIQSKVCYIICLEFKEEKSQGGQ